jgi:hypothetical protein
MKASWKFDAKHDCGSIVFGDGRTVFFQGESANEMNDDVEECDTDEEVQILLNQYVDLAE